MVNVATFMYVPPTYRILYVNFCGLAWNSFLSYQNVTRGAAAAAVQHAAEHARERAARAGAQ